MTVSLPKSPQVSRTLLSILAVLNNAVVWMVSTRPPTSKSSSPFSNPLVTVPKAPITIGIIATFMFHSFFQFPCKVEVLIVHFTFFQFYPVVSRDIYYYYYYYYYNCYYYYYYYYYLFIYWQFFTSALADSLSLEFEWWQVSCSTVFFTSLASSRYLSFFSLSFNFTLWSVETAKSTVLQVLFFCWLL